MDGPAKMTCLDDGTWSDIFPTCSPPPCLEPPLLLNGKSKPSDTMDFESSLITNVTKAICNEGYILRNPNIDHFVCKNSQWRGPNGSNYLPDCVSIDCGNLPTISHSRYSRRSGSSGYRSKSILLCNEGYTFVLKNPREVKVNQKVINVVCSSKQKWTASSLTTEGRNIPFSTFSNNLKCRKRRCPLPIGIQYGMVEFSGLTVGSMARYSCERPYKIKGRAQIRCLPTGKWDKQLPMCKRYEI